MRTFCKASMGIFFSILSVFAFLAQAEVAEVLEQTLHGRVLGEKDKKHVFDWRSSISIKAERLIFEVEFTSLSGKSLGANTIVAQERWERDSDGSGRYSYIRHSTGEKAEVSWEQGHIQQKLARGDKEKNYSKTIEGDLAVGPGLFMYIYEHWSSLSTGEPRGIKLAVPELNTVINFELQLIKENAGVNEEEYLLRLRPTNVLYRIFSKATYFRYKKGAAIPYSTTMPMLPLIEDNGVFKRFLGVLEISEGNIDDVMVLLDAAQVKEYVSD